MDINYNFINLLDFLGLVQGVLLGLILMIRNKKNRPSLWLGLFLITYAIELLSIILYETGFDYYHSSLLFMPINFLFLHPAFLYLYVKSLTQTQTIAFKNYWMLFIPGVIEFIASTFLYSLPMSTKMNVQEHDNFVFFADCYFYTATIYGIFISLKVIQLIHEHQEKVMDYFSNTKNRQLKWVKWVAIYLIVYGLAWFSLLFITHETINEVMFTFLSIINVIFIFWAGISGLEQTIVEMVDYDKYKHPNNVPNSEIVDNLDAKAGHVGTKIDAEPTETHHTKTNHPQAKIAPIATKASHVDTETFQKLTALMTEKEFFKNADLTLPVLAQELNMTRRNLSSLINQQTGTNFNYFINEYRVAEAKKILLDDQFNHLNMLGIAYEVGFNSKATFFSVFKKMEGIPPGTFKKQRLSTISLK